MPVLTKKQQQEIQSFFTKKWERLRFARVGKVIKHGESQYFLETLENIAEKSYNTNICQIESPDDLSNFELQHNLIEKNSNFEIITNAKPVVTGAEHTITSSVRIRSKCLGKLNMFTGRIHISKQPESQIVPKIGDMMVFVLKPHRDDSPDILEGFGMIVSEQFFRMVCLFRYGKYPVNRNVNVIQTLSGLREYSFSGNRLAGPDSFQKWFQSMIDCDRDIDLSEAIIKFYTKRTENVECHVYAAICIIGLYGELPNSKNVPHNLNRGGPWNRRWLVPSNFVRDFLTKACPSFNPINVGLLWDTIETSVFEKAEEYDIEKQPVTEIF